MKTEVKNWINQMDDCKSKQQTKKNWGRYLVCYFYWYRLLPWTHVWVHWEKGHKRTHTLSWFIINGNTSSASAGNSPSFNQPIKSILIMVFYLLWMLCYRFISAIWNLPIYFRPRIRLFVKLVMFTLSDGSLVDIVQTNINAFELPVNWNELTNCDFINV